MYFLFMKYGLKVKCRKALYRVRKSPATKIFSVTMSSRKNILYNIVDDPKMLIFGKEKIFQGRP